MTTTTNNIAAIESIRDHAAAIRSHIAGIGRAIAPWDVEKPLRELSSAMVRLARIEKTMSKIEMDGEHADEACDTLDALYREIDAAWAKVRGAALDE